MYPVSDIILSFQQITQNLQPPFLKNHSFLMNLNRRFLKFVKTKIGFYRNLSNLMAWLTVKSIYVLFLYMKWIIEKIVQV